MTIPRLQPLWFISGDQLNARTWKLPHDATKHATSNLVNALVESSAALGDNDARVGNAEECLRAFAHKSRDRTASCGESVPAGLAKGPFLNAAFVDRAFLSTGK